MEKEKGRQKSEKRMMLEKKSALINETVFKKTAEGTLHKQQLTVRRGESAQEFDSKLQALGIQKQINEVQTRTQW